MLFSCFTSSPFEGCLNFETVPSFASRSRLGIGLASFYPYILSTSNSIVSGTSLPRRGVVLGAETTFPHLALSVDGIAITMAGGGSWAIVGVVWTVGAISCISSGRPCKAAVVATVLVVPWTLLIWRWPPSALGFCWIHGSIVGWSLSLMYPIGCCSWACGRRICRVVGCLTIQRVR